MSTFTKRITAGEDDCYVYADGSTISLSSVYFGDIGVSINTGLRFNNITIPKSSTINSAKLTFKANTTQSGTTVAVRIYGKAADNTDTWSTSNKPTAGTNTTAYVDWTIPAWTGGSFYDSPDFKDVIQEIINRSGWASDNSLSLVLNNNSSGASKFRIAYDYAESASNSALLTIDYTAASGPANLKSVNGLAKASVKSKNGLAIASVKSINGLS